MKYLIGIEGNFGAVYSEELIELFGENEAVLKESFNAKKQSVDWGSKSIKDVVLSLINPKCASLIDYGNEFFENETPIIHAEKVSFANLKKEDNLWSFDLHVDMDVENFMTTTALKASLSYEFPVICGGFSWYLSTEKKGKDICEVSDYTANNIMLSFFYKGKPVTPNEFCRKIMSDSVPFNLWEKRLREIGDFAMALYYLEYLREDLKEYIEGIGNVFKFDLGKTSELFLQLTGYDSILEIDAVS